MRIRHKLEIGFGVVILMLAAVTGGFAWQLTQSERAMTHLEHTLLQQMELSRLQAQMNRQMKELGEYVTIGNEEELEEFQETGLEIADAFDQWKRYVNEEIEHIDDEHRQEEMEELAALDGCRRSYLDIMTLSSQICELAREGKKDEAIALLEYRIEPIYDDGLDRIIRKQLADGRSEVMEIRAQIWDLYGFTRKLILVLAAFAFICASATSRIVTGSIARPLGRLRGAAARIGQGNLDTEIHLACRDEVGELAVTFNQMARDLKATTASIDDLQHEMAQRQKAEENLAASNEELTQFAYVISHDLKAPLRGIKLIVEYLCEDYGDKFGEEAAEQFGLLKNRVERMYDLIDGVLQYSRVGRTEENLTAVDLNEVVADVVDMVLPPEHIEVVVDKRLPSIVCGTTRISQVFQNLISNGIKYMDKPQGRIVIGCSEDEEAWTFSVSDNGPGIEEKHFDRIFQIFQTLNARDQFESTGVGLTLVKKIVEMYGGRIWVTSEVGQGSTFLFTFPKRPTNVQEMPAAAGTVSDGSGL